MPFRILRNDTTAYGLSRLHLVSEEQIDPMHEIDGVPEDAIVESYKNGSWNYWILWKDGGPRSVTWLSWPRTREQFDERKMQML